MTEEKTTVSDTNDLQPGETPTLKTIARLSGMAVPTVSRALNDAPDIKQSTKEKVRAIAERIGYVPNRAGVRLRTGRTNVISLVIATNHDNHSTKLISSVAESLDGTRFHLNVMPYRNADDQMRPIRYIVETGSADAIIFNQIEPADPRVSYLMERGFPFATHGRSQWSDQHAYYDYDNEIFGHLAMDMLHARGRGHVMAIVPPQVQNYSLHLAQGLRARAGAHGMALNLLGNVSSDAVGNEVVAAVADQLHKHPETDAIIAASTSSAMAAVVAVEGMGLTVGQQIDVFAKEAYPFLRMFRADILTLPEKVDDAGQFLAAAAIQAIREPGKPPMQFLEVPKIPNPQSES